MRTSKPLATTPQPAPDGFTGVDLWHSQIAGLCRIQGNRCNRLTGPA